MSKELQDHAQAHGASGRRLAGLVRRMAVKLTKGPLWQLLGHKVKGEQESPDAEPFSGIGFYARPRSGSKAEAALIAIGQAAHSVIIATRDEDLRKLWAKTGVFDTDDVAGVFNGSVIVMLKKDGKVEIRSKDGTAKRLAFQEDLEALADDFYGHTHLENGTGPIESFDPLDPPIDPAPMTDGTSDGTEVLRGE